MGLLNKLGIAAGGGASRNVSPRASTPAHTGPHTGHGAPPVTVGANRTPQGDQTTRVSNGLKEFLWNLDGLGRGTLLDFGPAWQTTLNFFIERGFRVTSDDLLHSWKDFLAEEEVRVKNATTSTESLDLTPAGRAARFVQANIQYAPASFDAVLLWDILDYMEPVVAKQTVASLTELLRPGGIVFAMFHSKKPENFQRYRVADSSTLQVIGAARLVPAQRVYQNREIQDLFNRFRTVKSFVGRDQLRESLFVK
ncbi:MAG TPA: class I SAM-dependent methyltransferase [Candidatus Eisenbacteria bacterium]|nr:class I SAM-dependent methyltransferase [Candidatus Eisenbacteria bacterium]